MTKTPEIALVNDDYEYLIFKDEIGTSAEIKVTKHYFDYLFIFMNQKPNQHLYLPQMWPVEYLDYLRELGLQLPTITTSHWTYNWYGKMTDLEKEKKINSKLFSYELLNELGLNPVPNFVVSSPEEVKQIIKQHSYSEWLLKCPYQMGGNHFFKIKEETDVPDIYRPYILEPLLDRVLDVSYFYNNELDRVDYYVNVTTSDGKYCGGLVFENERDLEKYFEQQGYHHCYPEWKRTSAIILERVKAMKVEQPFSVDGFIYRENGQYKLHPMNEINYRQTFGGFLISLKRFLNPGGVGYLFSVKLDEQSMKKDFMPYNKDMKRGLIYLSPPHIKNLQMFCCGQNVEEATRIKKMYLKYLHHSKNMETVA